MLSGLMAQNVNLVGVFISYRTQGRQMVTDNIAYNLCILKARHLGALWSFESSVAHVSGARRALAYCFHKSVYSKIHTK